MATKSETIYTHTCDLCGGARARKEMRRLGLVDIPEGNPVSYPPKKVCDVCPDCADRPVSEVLAILGPPEDAELAGLRQMVRGRSARPA